jgi:hypothetical protein
MTRPHLHSSTISTYITPNSHTSVLLQIGPKLTARYIHGLYKADKNIQILATQSIVSKWYFTWILYFISFYILF